MTDFSGGAMTGMALEPAQMQRYESLFYYHAGDENSVTLTQLANLLPAVGIFLSEQDRGALFQAIDVDNSGDIEFREFIDLVTQQRQLTQLAGVREDRESFRQLRDNMQVPAWALWPDGGRRAIVDLFVSLATIFYAVIVPTDTLALADHGASGCAHWMIGGCGVGLSAHIPAALVFLIDLLLRCITMRAPSYWEPATLFTTAFRALVRRYLSSRSFVIDLLAGVPVDLCCGAAGFHSVRVGFQWLRLLKVLRIPSLFPTGGRTLLTPGYVRFHYTWVPLIRVAFWGIFIICVLAFVWAVLDPDRPNGQMSYTYCMSYVTQMLTGVGFTQQLPRTQGQEIFTMILVCIHTIVVAFAVGKVTLIMQRADIESDTEQRMLETVSVLKHLDIPRNFTQELLAFQSFVLHTSHDVFGSTLKDLPATIRDRMELYARMKVVRNVHRAFNKVPDVCVARLAQALVSLAIPPDEYLIITGEEARELFFLLHGMCCVVRPSDDAVIATVKRGGAVGAQEALGSGTGRHTANVRALTYCSLFRLSAEDVLVAAEDFPALHDGLNQEGLDVGGAAERRRTSQDSSASDAPSPRRDANGDTINAINAVTVNVAQSPDQAGALDQPGLKVAVSSPRVSPATQMQRLETIAQAPTLATGSSESRASSNLRDSGLGQRQQTVRESGLGQRQQTGHCPLDPPPRTPPPASQPERALDAGNKGVSFRSTVSVSTVHSAPAGHRTVTTAPLKRDASGLSLGDGRVSSEVLMDNVQEAEGCQHASRATSGPMLKFLEKRMHPSLGGLGGLEGRTSSWTPAESGLSAQGGARGRPSMLRSTLRRGSEPAGTRWRMSQSSPALLSQRTDPTANPGGVSPHPGGQSPQQLESSDLLQRAATTTEPEPLQFPGVQTVSSPIAGIGRALSCVAPTTIAGRGARSRSPCLRRWEKSPRRGSPRAAAAGSPRPGVIGSPRPGASGTPSRQIASATAPAAADPAAVAAAVAPVVADAVARLFRAEVAPLLRAAAAERAELRGAVDAVAARVEQIHRATAAAATEDSLEDTRRSQLRTHLSVSGRQPVSSPFGASQSSSRFPDRPVRERSRNSLAADGPERESSFEAPGDKFRSAVDQGRRGMGVVRVLQAQAMMGGAASGATVARGGGSPDPSASAQQPKPKQPAHDGEHDRRATAGGGAPRPSESPTQP